MNDIVEHKNTSAMMLDSNAIASYKDMAKLMSQALVQVPMHLQGKPADCLAVVMQAAQWRMNPFVVAQKTSVVNGSLVYEAQLVNAVVSSSNSISGRFHYEYQGSDAEWKPSMKKENRNGKDVWIPQFNAKACLRVGAIINSESEITWGEWLYPADQSIYNSPLWRTNPKQQTAYLGVKFWSRLYTPDVLLGVYTPDEMQDAKQIKDITPKNEVPASAAMERLKSVVKPKQEESIDKDETAYHEWSTAIDSTNTKPALTRFVEDILASDRMKPKTKARLLSAIEYKIEKIEEIE